MEGEREKGGCVFLWMNMFERVFMYSKVNIQHIVVGVVIDSPRAGQCTVVLACVIQICFQQAQHLAISLFLGAPGKASAKC